MSFTKLLIVSELFSVVWLLGVCWNECHSVSWMLAVLKLVGCWVFRLLVFRSPLPFSGAFIFFFAV